MNRAVPIALLSVLSLFRPAFALSQDLEAEARELRFLEKDNLSKLVGDDLERRARQALDGIFRARSADDLERQRPALRRKLEESLGIRRLPWPPDLQPVLTGRIEREGYRIDKLAIQTLPGVWAPAHLYLPQAMPAPAAAVLLLNTGAWGESKTRPDVQAFAINAARFGFVVFAFDAFGQGEREDSAANDRRPELRLVGLTQQALVQYEVRCALQYLRLHAEADPERIGMVGGGFAAWIAAALEDDVKAAVILADTTDFREQVRSLRSRKDDELDDRCALIPGILRYANLHELAALIAPRPLLIVQSSSDTPYSRPVADSVREYGVEVYSALGRRKGIAFAEGGPGFQQGDREAAYGWFVRWLASGAGGEPIEEPETVIETVDSPALAVLPEGRTASSEPGVSALIAGLAEELIRQIATFRPEPLLDGATPRAGWGIGLNPGRISRHVGRTQPGIQVPWLALRPGPEGASPSNGVLVAIDDRGKEELVADPIVREAVERRGWQVWAIDPRGFGELRSTNPAWFFHASVLLGEDPLWRQAFDIRRFLEKAENMESHVVGLYTRGPGASLAGAYALATARPQPEIAIFRDGFRSFLEVWALEQSSRPGVSISKSSALFGEDKTPQHWFARNALEAGDLPAFLEASEAAKYIVEPLDGSDASGASSVRVLSLAEFLRADWP